VHYCFVENVAQFFANVAHVLIQAERY